MSTRIISDAGYPRPIDAILLVKHFASRHEFNVPVDMAPAPQLEVQWDAPIYYRRGGILGIAQFVRFHCAPIAAEDRYGDPTFVRDNIVYVRVFDGLSMRDYSTQTPAGPRFWSRFLRQETLTARLHPIDAMSASVPLQNREKILGFRFLVQSMAAFIVQSMLRSMPYRWLLNRAKRRRLFKAIILRPLVTTAEKASGLRLAATFYRIKILPDNIMRQVLAFV